MFAKTQHLQRMAESNGALLQAISQRRDSRNVFVDVGCQGRLECCGRHVYPSVTEHSDHDVRKDGSRVASHSLLWIHPIYVQLTNVWISNARDAYYIADVKGTG